MIKPLSDRVVILPDAVKDKSDGGLYLPPSATDKPPVTGEVVAVGVGRVTDDGNIVPMCVKVGHKVLYGKFSGTEVSFEGTDYIVIRESDILAII